MSRSLTGLVEAYLTDRQAGGASPRTVGEFRLNLGHLVRFLARRGITRADEVTPEALAAYQNALVTGGAHHGRPLAVGTQALRMGQVRTFFAALVHSDVLLVDPARRVQLPHVPTRVQCRVLSLAEVRRLLRAPRAASVLGLRDRAMLELMYSTGLRVSELTALHVADIDLAAGELTVRRGKGGQGRRIPVGAEACAWVQRYLAKSWPELARAASERVLFLSVRGQPLHRVNVETMVRTWARAAGLKMRVTPHSLRHAFATHLLRGRASLRHIQELLGHAKITTTQVYTRVDIADLKAVHRRCHPRGKLLL